MKIIDVRRLRTPEERAGVIYVGRAFAGWPASPWGNPFRTYADGKTGHRCSLGRYRDWIGRRPELVEELARQVAATGLPLGCWCVDWNGEGKPPADKCHAGILAELVMELGVKA